MCGAGIVNIKLSWSWVNIDNEGRIDLFVNGKLIIWIEPASSRKSLGKLLPSVSISIFIHPHYSTICCDGYVLKIRWLWFRNETIFSLFWSLLSKEHKITKTMEFSINQNPLHWIHCSCIKKIFSLKKFSHLFIQLDESQQRKH